jgi:hypothetical protein
MQQVVIDRFRIIPAPMTGIGWVSVQMWIDISAKYEHVATFRSRTEAQEYIERTSI